MGKASSNKKVARAARAAGRPGAKKSYAWPLAIGAVVIVGVLLVVLSFGGGKGADASPKLGEHWHAAYGVYDCDTYLGPESDTQDDQFGIHTHQDYLMHIHPTSTKVTGENATVGVLAEEVGMELSDTSLKTITGMDKSNGDECGGEKGTLKLLVWDDPSDEAPTVIEDDYAGYNPPDQSMWALAFVADGTEVPPPPGTINLQDPTAAEEGRQPVTATTVTTPEGSTATTAAPGTETTAPPAGGEPPSTDTTVPTTTIPPDDAPSTTEP